MDVHYSDVWVVTFITDICILYLWRLSKTWLVCVFCVGLVKYNWKSQLISFHYLLSDSKYTTDDIARSLWSSTPPSHLHTMLTTISAFKVTSSLMSQPATSTTESNKHECTDLSFSHLHHKTVWLKSLCYH